MENEIEWLDLTILGSDYEEQMSACGRYHRHRLRAIPGTVNFLNDGNDDSCIEFPWRDGPSPRP